MSRVVVAAVLLPLVLGIVWAGGWWLVALALVGGLLALHELYRMARGLHPMVLGGYAGLVLTLLGAQLGNLPWLLAGILATLPIALMVFFVSSVRQNAVAAFATTLLGVAWVGGGLAHLMLVRDIPDDGRLLVFTVLLTVFADDTAAYVVGRAIGRHKLAPAISPGKSWEGFVAGTLVGIARGRPEHELVELLGHRRVLRARRRHRVVRVLIGDLHRRLAHVGLLAREHLVRHDAERVDVAAGIGDASGHELGGEVRDRAEQGLPGRGVRARGAREPEVAQLDAAVVGEQHVLGLEVAVHDAGLVRGGEPREHGVEDVDGLLGREPPVVLQQVAQGDARQVLHDEVRHVGVLALVEDVHHVRVREAGGRAGLLHEPRLERVVVGEVAVHDLDRDAPLEPEVGGEVDGRHAAARDARAHLIPAVDETADHRVDGRGGHRTSVRRAVCRQMNKRRAVADRNGIVTKKRMARGPQASSASQRFAEASHLA